MKNIRTILIKSLFIICLFQSSILFSQNISQEYLDSIQRLDYSTILNLIPIDNQELGKELAAIYLKKAKQESSISEISMGYIILSNIYKENYERSHVYIDSAITLTQKNKKYNLTTLAYMNSAITESFSGHFDRALNDHLYAIKFAEKANNNTFVYYTKHNLGILRRTVGDYDEAKKMFKECINYEYTRDVLTNGDSLSIAITQNELINTYIVAKQLDSAFALNKYSLLNNKNIDLKRYYLLNRGVENFYKNNNEEALVNINEAINEILDIKYDSFDRTYYLMFSKLYLGKAFLKAKQIEKSKTQFNFIDSISRSDKYYNSIVKEALFHLIEIYKNQDSEKELKYINRLLEVDSIVDNQTKKVNTNFIKKYDIPELLKSKEALIKKLEKKNILSSKLVISSIITSFFLLFLFIYINKRRRIFYKAKYDEFIKGYEENLKTSSLLNLRQTEINKPKDIGIPSEIVRKILYELDNFERYKGFLEKSITLPSLASSFNTNSKYLSKVINHNKEKSFTAYINELRINHFIEMIKTSPKSRKYTIKALAAENGFNSTEVFAKTFKKITGVYPSFFIKQQENKDLTTKKDPN